MTADRTGGEAPTRVSDFHRAEDADERGEGICRTCLAPIWNEGGTIGGQHRDTGWSDRIERGGDSLVCFKAVDYRHVPLTGREACIYDRAYQQGAAEVDDRSQLGPCVNPDCDADGECSCPGDRGFVVSPVQGEAAPLLDVIAWECPHGYDYASGCPNDCEPPSGVQGEAVAGTQGRLLAKHQLAEVLPFGVLCTCGAELASLNAPLDDAAVAGEPLALAVHQLQELRAMSRVEGGVVESELAAVWVRFGFSDADPVAECECGWRAVGDAPVDAFRAWWTHRASHDYAAPIASTSGGEAVETATRWRKKPVEIEAMRVTLDAAGWPSAVVAAWCGGLALRNERGARIEIQTLEGTMRADPGDWVIRGVQGEFYPCKPDIFAATYEPVTGSPEHPDKREAIAREAAVDHDFLPVNGHPDDDECTHRTDGTDVTYCGLPREAHERPPGGSPVHEGEDERLAKIRERAQSEIDDAKAGEQYHAEINNGGALMAEQARRSAWETVLRLAGESS